MDSKISALSLTVLMATFAVLTAFAAAQLVDTDPRMITVVENQENVNLHCRIGRPTDLCLIKVPGFTGQFSLSPDKPSPQAGLRYFGEGYQSGSCGVTIERVTADNSGNMTCTLLVGGKTLIGEIEIVVAFAPENPEIQVQSGDIDHAMVNSELTFSCVAARGNPAATITWFLDNEQIYEGVRPVQPEENFDEVSGKRYFTAASTLTHSIRAEDNGKRLTCQAEHLAYPEGVSRTDRILNVNFQPQALPDQVIYGLQLGRTATAGLVIKANPAPVVMWNIDGIDYHQGTETGRYAVAMPEPLGNNRYNVTLTIAGLTLEDLSKTYMLRASNSYGAEDYRVQLRSQDEVVSEAGGVGTGEIVGLVLAALIVLTAVALILVARATGRWCFRGDSLNTDINPDSEAQIAPHPHDDELDEKMQTQDPAAHFVHEGKTSSTSTSAAKIGETDTTDNGVGETMLPPPSGNARNGRNTVASLTPSEVVVTVQPTTDEENHSKFAGGDGSAPPSSILRPVNLRGNPLDGAAYYYARPGGREPQPSINSSNFDNASMLSDSSSTYGGRMVAGDPNQVGLPPSGPGQKRWIPHQQRELLEKQAQLLLSGAAIKRKRETEIL